MRLFIKHAWDPVCVKRSIKVAFVVGTVLFIINHFDELINGTLNATNVFQIGLTYCVPYVVSTFGSAMQARHIELNGSSRIEPKSEKIQSKDQKVV